MDRGGSPTPFAPNTPCGLGTIFLRVTRKSTGISLAPGGL